MPLSSGTHPLGPDNGALRIETARRGAAAKAGHDLVIEVTSWEGTLEVGDDGSVTALVLEADPRSLEVREGHGGVVELKDEDRSDIKQTIADEVLASPDPVGFHSTGVERIDGGRMRVRGELALNGASHPIELELDAGDDGSVAGSAKLAQSEWGIEPYSGLFGALKVADEVKVAGEASVPAG